MWENGNVATDRYEKRWDRGLDGFKHTTNYGAYTNPTSSGPTSSDTNAVEDPNGDTSANQLSAPARALYTARHMIPELYIKTGNANNAGSPPEPGAGKVTSYNITWSHFINDWHCDNITADVSAPLGTSETYPDWPPNGSYWVYSGSGTTWTLTAFATGTVPPSVWFTHHFYLLKVWGEPFYYFFDGEPERDWEVHNLYWQDTGRVAAQGSRTGADAGRNGRRAAEDPDTRRRGLLRGL